MVSFKQKSHQHSIASALVIPIILIAFYLAVLIFLRGAIPTPEEITTHFSSLYARYGYEIIFIGAALEALVIVNFFVPGVLAVGLGVIFAKTGQVNLTTAVITACLGAMVGFCIDFILGFFGFGEVIKKIGHEQQLNNARDRILKSGIKGFSFGFIHPNIGSLISLAAGTLKINFFNFFIIALFSTILWFSIWGMLIFAFGDIFLTLITKYFIILMLLILSIWVLSILRKPR